MQVNIHEAKSQLSKLAELVTKGEKVVIARAGTPYVDLVPHREPVGPRAPGRFKGRIRMAPDFYRTPDEVIQAFEGD
jgi:antitoxin (DNA-binding transcriptional repressor) of toxin-antitoxin stability system